MPQLWGYKWVLVSHGEHLSGCSAVPAGSSSIICRDKFIQFGCPGRAQGKSLQANPSTFSPSYDLPAFLQTFPDIHTCR